MSNQWTAEFEEHGGYDCMAGAWAITSESRPIAVVDQTDYGQKHCDYSFRSSEAEANAHLIAAAPELLAACKEFVATWGPSTDYTDEAVKHSLALAETAISRAEGRS